MAKLFTIKYNIFCRFLLHHIREVRPAAGRSLEVIWAAYVEVILDADLNVIWAPISRGVLGFDGSKDPARLGDFDNSNGAFSLELRFC